MTFGDLFQDSGVDPPPAELLILKVKFLHTPAPPAVAQAEGVECRRVLCRVRGGSPALAGLTGRNRHCQPSGPNPVYHRDDVVDRPRAMRV